jgi:enoyl-CoA hydratase
MTSVTLSVADGIGTIVLDGERRNALDVRAMRALATLLEEVGRNASIRCVVLTGAGGAFCAGADLGDDLDGDAGLPMLEATCRVTSLLTRIPQPVISAVRGPAAGAACSMVFASDLVVADESAYFLLPFGTIGLIPDAGATLTVAASLGRARAMRMALLREPLLAAEAQAAGVVARIYATDEFDAGVAMLARSVADGPRVAQARTKAAINDLSLGALGAALDRETHEQVPLLRARDFTEGVKAFLDRRAPVFTD